MEDGPLAIFFVKNGSNGDKMLFKYPFIDEIDHEVNIKNFKRNPYSLGSNKSLITQKSTSSSIEKDFSTTKLSQFVDEDLSHLLGVNRKLCGARFELKINDVRFIGHPVSLEDSLMKDPHKGNDRLPGSSILLFHIVFALKVSIIHDVVNCYHDLSRRLGIALHFEEQRCQFLSNEAKIMLTELDEQTHQPEVDHKKSVFQEILSKSLLAKHLKDVYLNLSTTGRVHLRLNNWIEISFSLPQKIRHGYGNSKRITHDILKKGLENIQPYHALLLLADRGKLLKMISADASPALRRLLDVMSPISSFYTLAADADLTLSHVFLLAGHLVYWGMAKVIYPVCNTNTYVLAPHTPTARKNKLAESFQKEFPDYCYHQTLCEYALPISLLDKCTPMCTSQEQQEENKKLLWLLKRGLLEQLHTYIQIIPQTSPRIRGVGLNTGTHASTRGILAPVAEDITEKQCEETDSCCSSFREELDWQEDSRDFSKYFGHMDLRRSSLTRSFRDSILEDDEHSQDSLSSGFHMSKKSNSEDFSFNLPLNSNSISRNAQQQQQTILSQSFTPSESEIGSVCSDDRSLSPSGTSQVTGESILHDLDLWLSASEKEMILNIESSKNLEDLKLFTNLCRYFRGEHHMEEIMYKANIPRSQLLEILDKFKAGLITAQRVDPSIYLGIDKCL